MKTTQPARRPLPVKTASAPFGFLQAEKESMKAAGFAALAAHVAAERPSFAAALKERSKTHAAAAAEMRKAAREIGLPGEEKVALGNADSVAKEEEDE